jgi:hypothetical protein
MEKSILTQTVTTNLSLLRPTKIPPAEPLAGKENQSKGILPVMDFR